MPKNKFKAGDRLVPKRDMVDIGARETVVVKGRALETDLYAWIFIDGRRNSTSDGSYKEDDFDLWQPSAFLPDNAFIRVTANGEVPGTFKAGDVGKVDGRTEYAYRVNFGADSWLVDFGNVEAWEPRVGERVRFVRWYASKAAGTEALVVLTPPDSWGYRVRQIKGGGDSTESLNSLEPVLTSTPVATPTAPARVNVAATVDYLAEEYGGGVAAPVAEKPAKTKRKIGDKVRIARIADGRGDYLHSCIGKTSVVDSLEGTDGTKISVADLPYWFWAAETELVEPPTSAIVARLDNGQPRPNPTPFVHFTLASAEAEAQRLANIHVGKKFGVYVLTGEPAVVEKAKPTKVEELTIKLTLDTADLERKLREARQRLADFERLAAA